MDNERANHFIGVSKVSRQGQRLQCPTTGANANVQYMKAALWYSVGGALQIKAAKDNFIDEWSRGIQNQNSGHTKFELDVLQQEGIRLL